MPNINAIGEGFDKLYREKITHFRYLFTYLLLLPLPEI